MQFPSKSRAINVLPAAAVGEIKLQGFTAGTAGGRDLSLLKEEVLQYEFDKNICSGGC